MCHSVSLGDPLLLMCASLCMMYDLMCNLKQSSNVEPPVAFTLWMENAKEYFVSPFVVGLPNISDAQKSSLRECKG